MIRDDPEGYYKNKDIKKVIFNLSKEYNTSMLDTDIQASRFLIYNKKKYLVEKFLHATLSKCELVITDRFHGIIFALIANKPVIVLKTTDHKLTSGIQWFQKRFNKYVYFSKNLDLTVKYANLIMNKKNKIIISSNFFTKIFNDLKKDL